MNLTYLNEFVIQVRRDIVRMVHNVNSGHPGGSLGCTEFLVALYGELMNRNETFDMNGHGEDLFSYPMVTFLPYFTAFLPVADTFRLKNSIPSEK